VEAKRASVPATAKLPHHRIATSSYPLGEPG
jgi:hypothetical protein